MVGAPFEIREGHEPGLVRLTLLGELDLSTAAALKERLLLLRSNARVVRLDLSKLEFIDSSGLQVILEAVRDAEGLLEVESELAPQAKRLFEVTHTDRLILAGTNKNG